MNTTKYINLIKSQIAKYPEMQTVDILKLVYQSMFGPAHFVFDEEFTLKLIKDELLITQDNTNIEYIYNYYRVGLNVIKELGLGENTLNKLFILSAQEVEDDEAFISLVKQLIPHFSEYNIEEQLNKYLAKRGPFSHSARYNEVYKPHYRLVKQDYITYLPLLVKIEELLKTKNNPIILLEGNCSSGKTFLSNLLNSLYNTSIVRADDFFLVRSGKTDERLKEVGGNIDYERFSEEVSSKLTSTSSFEYNKYSCSLGKLDGKVFVDNNKIRVIEGSYSKNPKMGIKADLSVFLTLDYEEQLIRLEKRNPHLLQRFITEWIPKENEYFDTFDITKDFDLVINTSQNRHK